MVSNIWMMENLKENLSILFELLWNFFGNSSANVTSLHSLFFQYEGGMMRYSIHNTLSCFQIDAKAAQT